MSHWGQGSILLIQFVFRILFLLICLSIFFCLFIMLFYPLLLQFHIKLKIIRLSVNSQQKNNILITVYSSQNNMQSSNNQTNFLVFPSNNYLPETTPPLSRNQSLVLSVTAQKFQSPYQSDLLKDSYQYLNYNLTERTSNDKEVGKNSQELGNLDDLGYRLKMLEGKVESIKTQRVYTESECGVEQDQSSKNQQEMCKQNIALIANKQEDSICTNPSSKSANRIGCFLKKTKKRQCEPSPFETQIEENQSFVNKLKEDNFYHQKTKKNSHKNYKKVNAQETFINGSGLEEYRKNGHHRNEHIFRETPKSFTIHNTNKSSAPQTPKSHLTQLYYLQQRLRKLSHEKQRSEHSQGAFARRLSQTKHSLSKARIQSRKNIKVIREIQGKLKKSENIRQKQKTVIGKQNKEIKHLKQIIKQLKKQMRRSSKDYSLGSRQRSRQHSLNRKMHQI